MGPIVLRYSSLKKLEGMSKIDKVGARRDSRLPKLLTFGVEA